MPTYVNVEVRVSDVLDELDDDDLIDELKQRKALPEAPPADLSEDVEELFYALKYGTDEKALEVARRIAQEHTGRIL